MPTALQNLQLAKAILDAAGYPSVSIGGSINLVNGITTPQAARQYVASQKAQNAAIAKAQAKNAAQNAAAAKKLATEQAKAAKQQADAKQKSDLAADNAQLKAQKIQDANTLKIQQFETKITKEVAAAGTNALTPKFQERIMTEQDSFKKTLAKRGGNYVPLIFNGMSLVAQNFAIAQAGLGQSTNAQQAAQIEANANALTSTLAHAVLPTPVPVLPSSLTSPAPALSSNTVTQGAATPPNLSAQNAGLAALAAANQPTNYGSYLLIGGAAIVLLLLRRHHG